MDEKEEYPRTIGMVLLGVFLLGLSIVGFVGGVLVIATISQYVDIARSLLLLLGIFFLFMGFMFFIFSMALFDFKSFFRVLDRIFYRIEKFLSRRI